MNFSEVLGTIHNTVLDALHTDDISGNPYCQLSVDKDKLEEIISLLSKDGNTDNICKYSRDILLVIRHNATSGIPIRPVGLDIRSYGSLNEAWARYCGIISDQNITIDME